MNKQVKFDLVIGPLGFRFRHPKRGSWTAIAYCHTPRQRYGYCEYVDGGRVNEPSRDKLLRYLKYAYGATV